jgi:DNA-binding transcriptional LysR family regulator
VHLLPGWQVPLGALCLYYPGHRLVPPALRALSEFAASAAWWMALMSLAAIRGSPCNR